MAKEIESEVEPRDDGKIVQHADNVQRSLEQLIIQDTDQAASTNLQTNVGHENLHDIAEVTLGVSAADLNATYMQSNSEGNMAITKKEFHSSIEDDKNLEKAIIEEEKDQAQAEGKVEFNKLNFAMVAQNLVNAGLDFNAISFGQTSENGYATANKISLAELLSNAANQEATNNTTVANHASAATRPHTRAGGHGHAAAESSSQTNDQAGAQAAATQSSGSSETDTTNDLTNTNSAATEQTATYQAAIATIISPVIIPLALHVVEETTTSVAPTAFIEQVITTATTPVVNTVPADYAIVPPVNLNMTENGVLQLNAADLLANASDVDGAALTLSNVTTTQGTLIDNNNNTWTLLPAQNYTGNIALTFSVSDGASTTNQALTVNVNPAVDTPVLSSLTMTILENSMVIINLSDLLASATDPEGQNLSVTNLSSSGGALTNNNNGTWTFIPNDNYTGSTNISYTVSDGQTTATQQIAVSVVQSIPDLHFEVNNQDNTIPNYTSNDNSQIDQPPQLNNTYFITGDGINMSETYNAVQNATIIMEQVASGPTNIDATSQNAATVDLVGFTRTDVNLGGGGNSTVIVDDASRGDITTADGNNTINLVTSATDDGNGTAFKITTGTGNSTINITGNDIATTFQIQTGAGNNNIDLQGKYASADIEVGSGDNTITGAQGNDTVHFGVSQIGHDIYYGDSTINSGWSDMIMLDANSLISIISTGTYSWSLIVDGQQAHLATDTAGTINHNHLDFAAATHGTLTMADGSSLEFHNVEHVEW